MIRTPQTGGQRDDGTLVLFDWERCTRGSPAIDLAIAVPGLGSRAAFERVAAVYCGIAPGIDSRQLGFAIARSKVWSVIEFLAGYARGSIAPAFPVEPLLEDVPAWMSDVGSW